MHIKCALTINYLQRIISLAGVYNKIRVKCIVKYAQCVTACANQYIISSIRVKKSVHYALKIY